MVPGAMARSRTGLLSAGSDGTSEIAPRVALSELKALTRVGTDRPQGLRRRSPKVEYRLTRKGRALFRSSPRIRDWGRAISRASKSRLKCAARPNRRCRDRRHRQIAEAATVAPRWLTSRR